MTQQMPESSAEQSRTALPGRTARPRAVACLTLLAVVGLALGPASLAAQTPRFIPPPDVQQPTLPPQPPQPSDPGQPGGGRGRGRPGAPDEKDKKPQKFGPISVLPLVTLWDIPLGMGPVVGPAFDDTRFMVAIKGKQIAAWAISDAALKWIIQDVVPVQTLAADSGRLYVVLDGEVAAYETTSAKPLWRVPSGGPVSTEPIAKSGWLILGLETGDVRAVRGETGEVVWTAKLGAPIKTRPVIVGDRLYVAPENKHLVAFDLVSGQQLWAQEFEGLVSGIAAQDQRVFVGTDRMFFGLDHAGHVKWKRRVGAEVIGQPVTDEANVYATFTDNTLLALGAGKGDLVWRAALSYRPISGPTRADDTLLLTGIAPVLHGYETKDGKPTPDFPLPVDARSIVAAAPHFVHGATFFQDTVLVLMAQGYVVAGRRVGPGFYTPFTDPGTACPPLTFPGEAPPPTAAVPPKA